MIELHAEAPKIIVPLFARTLPELTAQAAAAQRADAARLLLATAQAAAQRPGKALITMSMGRDGAVTRYCGGAFGSAATFGTLSAASAPGQPPVTLLKEKLILGEDL